MSRGYTSSPPHVPPWHIAGQLYFFFYFHRINRQNGRYINKSATFYKYVHLQYTGVHYFRSTLVHFSQLTAINMNLQCLLQVSMKSVALILKSIS
jgi:hypothetical protein